MVSPEPLSAPVVALPLPAELPLLLHAGAGLALLHLPVVAVLLRGMGWARSCSGRERTSRLRRWPSQPVRLLTASSRRNRRPVPAAEEVAVEESAAVTRAEEPPVGAMLLLAKARKAVEKGKKAEKENGDVAALPLRPSPVEGRDRRPKQGALPHRSTPRSRHCLLPKDPRLDCRVPPLAVALPINRR